MQSDHCSDLQKETGWSPELLCQLVDAVREYAIFGTDVSGTLTSWNIGAEAIFGYTASEAIGQDIAILFNDEDRANNVPENEREIARLDGYAEDQRWHVKKDGSIFFASGVCTPLRDEHGTVTGFAKIARDLTELTEAHKALESLNNTLEERVDSRTRELAAANEKLQHEISERKSAERQRVYLLRQIVRTQEDERKRIAREIHDHIGQQMVALQLNIAHVIGKREGDEPLLADLDRLRHTVKDIDTEVDFLVWELRPAMLEDFGLVEAVDNYVRAWSTQFSTAAEFKTVGGIKRRLLPEIEINFYRIVQEALNNTAKHAKADQVSVLLEQPDGMLNLIIEDNGVGFVPDSVMPATDHDRGLGLVGMKERAELLGGSFDIESSPGSGTTIYVRVPAVVDEERIHEN